MIKKTKMGFAAVFAVLCGVLPVQADEIRMGAEGAYAPFNYLDPNGQLKGFDIDVGNAICEKLKANCVWSANEWSGIIPALQSKKFDIMASSMAITESRKEQVNFSNPYYYNTMRFGALKDLGLKDVTPESAKGKVIGTQTGSIAADVLQRFFPDNEVKLYPTLGEAFMDMESGRIDLLLESKFALSDWLSKGADCCEFVGEEFLLDGTLGAGMAFRKEDEQLRTRVNQALEEILKDGTYDKISALYFNFDIRAKPKFASEVFAN
ncbi:transporter substrate-binding domain-containing protein [Ochrobactrum chromiisoli]|uniref:Transporter substrate-binding domain-containing protein n=1 Tax=Ochrobactrum chromiisoli TaxID=2993941 RepID=A0ABT3QR36_9HYPH|nr:transporter substrate-binding domain-containing protein [Ochrobactrum chromiisoli]MCX2698073.1 transporter substrate-binding domain-containing protein [Ochrobactrum chromiisoli]